MKKQTTTLLLVGLLLCVFHASIAQNRTLGLLQNDSLAYNGYTLFAPFGYTDTYLIDNCGKIVNTWTSDYPPGQAAYLLENGNLLRTAMVRNPRFISGGGGGRVELFSWEGDLLWSYNYSTNDVHQHHDIEYLPNGNILILAWERFSKEEAIANGRDPATAPGAIWATQIIEIEPMGEDEATIVWEWSVWDHLIQDRDSSLLNYGQIANHPERININHAEEDGSGGFVDWIHVNSIDYNAALDQILLSARKFHEIWIIDHSTTTEEASTSEGGRYNKGGDLLYRWGNPQIYGRGTSTDQQLYWQHDASWIPEAYPNAGDIVLFNNGTGRVAGNWSSIDRISPSLSEDGTYSLEADALTYLPKQANWQYPAAPDFSFYSRILSGVQILPNGNALICQGRGATIFEVTPEGEQVWLYKSPVSMSGPLAQGANTINNQLFRAYRYGADYPAFEGRSLEAQRTVELDIAGYECTIFEEMISSTAELSAAKKAKLYPNPSNGFCTIAWEFPRMRSLRVLNARGEVVLEKSIRTASTHLQLKEQGIYFVQIQEGAQQYIQKCIVL